MRNICSFVDDIKLNFNAATALFAYFDLIEIKGNTIVTTESGLNIAKLTDDELLYTLCSICLKKVMDAGILNVQFIKFDVSDANFYIAAEIVIRLRKKYDIKLICASPFEGFEKPWKDECNLVIKMYLSKAILKNIYATIITVVAFKLEMYGWWIIPQELSLRGTVNQAERRTPLTMQIK